MSARRPPEEPRQVSFDAAQLDGPYDCVFDVGAYVGDFAIACLHEWPGCTVDSFDPLRGVLNADGRWRWHRCALSDRGGVETMHRCDFLPSSSLLPMGDLHKEAFPYASVTAEVQVETRTLSEYADLIHGRALLKLDVQGAELKVLTGAERALSLFAAVVLEVSHVELYLGSPTPAEIAEAMTAAGFIHAGVLAVTRHPVTNEVLQTDDLWRRP
jgi:FkbM family methyltransferase